jgi:hypothetical protein
MKKHLTSSVAAVCAAFLFSLGAALQADEKITTVTTSSGTIADFGSDTLVIRTEAAPQPVTYSYTKTTTYTDEDGQPVAIEKVKSGVPVTVHYTKDGDRMVVSKVIVRKTVKTERD